MKNITANNIFNNHALADITIIDIRTPSEYAREHIQNSINIPANSLADLNTHQFQNQILLFHCKSGFRTEQSRHLLNNFKCKKSFCLEGGIDAWKKAGNPVSSNPKAPLPLMRQVQLIIGVLIIVSTALAYCVSPYFLILSGLIGAGLTVAGLTGFCGLAKLLMTLPYNKPKA